MKLPELNKTKGDRKFELIATSNGRSYSLKTRKGKFWHVKPEEPLPYRPTKNYKPFHAKVLTLGVKLFIKQHIPWFMDKIDVNEADHIETAST